MTILFNQVSRLVKGCKANERTAQEALYKLYYKEMLRVCYRYLKSDQLAKEALNAGFLKVFENISFYEAQKGELIKWIKTIIIRTCIDLGRKEAKFKSTEHAEDLENEIFVSPAILQKLYAQDLLKAIRVLPTATQLVFNLAVLEGYSHREISIQLQISESTSRWHLSEGKKQLRQLLQSPGHITIQPTENQN